MSYAQTYRTNDSVCYFQCIAHTVYRTEDGYAYALNNSDKDMLVGLMKRLEDLYLGGVEVLQYTILDNHLHIILSENKKFEIKASEMKKRYEKFHIKKKYMDARSVFCRQFIQRLNNISCFMRDLQWYSAIFFNNKRTINGHRKRGSLWNPRFRRCTLKGAKALFQCSLYVAMNPVRAGLVKHAEDYSWGSWGERKKYAGSHPHQKAWIKFYCNSELEEDCFSNMEKCFTEALSNLELAHDKHDCKIDKYDSLQALILNNNYFWDSGGIIHEIAGNLLIHDSPRSIKCQGKT